MTDNVNPNGPALTFRTFPDIPAGIPPVDPLRHNHGSTNPAIMISSYGVVVSVGSYSHVAPLWVAKGREAGATIHAGTACMYARMKVSTDGSAAYPCPLRGQVKAPPAPVVSDTPRPDVLTPIVTASPAPHQGDRFAAAMSEEGFAVTLPGTWFPPGTRLIGYGENAARERAAKHAALPSLAVALPAYQSVIASEERRYVDLDASKLEYLPGGIIRSGKQVAAIEPRVFDRLLSSRFARAFPGGVRPWRSIQADDSEAAATIINRRLRTLSDYGYKDEHTRIRIGTRQLADQPMRSVFLVGSDMFMPLDPAVMLATLARTVDAAGARVDLSYDAASTETLWTITLHADADQMIGAGVGSVFQAGLKGSTRDDGTGHFRSGGTFIRVRCVNLTIAEGSVPGQLSLVHRGGRSSWRRSQRQAIHKLRQAAASQAADFEGISAAFLASWGVAETTVVGSRTGNPAKDTATLDRLLKTGRGTAEKSSKLTAIPAVALAAAVGATFGEETRRDSITVADVVNVGTHVATHGLLDSLDSWRLHAEVAQILNRSAVLVAARA